MVQTHAPSIKKEIETACRKQFDRVMTEIEGQVLGLCDATGFTPADLAIQGYQIIVFPGGKMKLCSASEVANLGLIASRIADNGPTFEMREVCDFSLIA